MYMAGDFVLHDITQPKDLNKTRNSAMNKGSGRLTAMAVSRWRRHGRLL